MNEQDPGLAPIESTSAGTAYQDRSTGLIVFGVLTILLGCLSGLLVPLLLFGQEISARPTNSQLNLSLILPGIIMYAAMAVGLVWLGIGSILARRWARAILLIFSWSWLGVGVLAMGMTAYVLPKSLANLPPAGSTGQPVSNAAVMGIILVVTFAVDGFLFIILPGIWTFFYSGRQVKATCDARNPAPSWTDACPLPVLALCLWLVFSIPTLLVMPMTGHSVMPFFGMFLTGLPGALCYLALALFWSCSAWLLFRLDRRGWWMMLIAMCAFLVSSILTYARHDILEMYRLMDYPQGQIDQLQKSGLLVGNRMIWLTLIFLVPFLGYLVYIRKYLRRP